MCDLVRLTIKGRMSQSILSGLDNWREEQIYHIVKNGIHHMLTVILGWGIREDAASKNSRPYCIFFYCCGEWVPDTMTMLLSSPCIRDST